jgi:hypothetical protein
MSTKEGLGFIYSALELLSQRYGLNDVVIVLERQDATTQVFRLGGRAVSPDFVTQFGAVAGLHCEPPVVAPEDVELVMSMCQQAFARRSARFRETRSAQHSLDHPEQNIDVRETHIKHGGIGEPRAAVDSRKNSRGLRSPYRVRDGREKVSQLLFGVDVVILALTLAHVHGPIRFVAGLILGLVIPGWSVVGWVRLKNAALEVSLTMAASLAMIMIAAQVLITINLWHLDGLEIVTCVVCLPSLLGLAGYLPLRSVRKR